MSKKRQLIALSVLLMVVISGVVFLLTRTGETPADPGATDPARAETSNQSDSTMVNTTKLYHYKQSIFMQMDIGEGYFTNLTNIDEYGVLSLTKILTPHANSYELYIVTSNGSVEEDNSTAVGYVTENEFNYATAVAYDKKNGNYYTLVNDNDAIYTINFYNEKLSLITKGIPYEWNNGAMYSEKLCYYDGKLFFIDTKYKLHINNIAGTSMDVPVELSKSEKMMNIRSIDIDNQGNLYFLSEEMSGSASFGKYDLEKEELVYQENINNYLVGNIYLHFNESTNFIYVADEKGIYQFDADGDGEKNDGEQIVAFGEDTSFLFGTNLKLTGFICDNDGNFYLAVSGFDEGKNSIYKLTKTYGEQLEDNRTEIVITASYKQMFLIDAIARYNAISEDYQVIFDTLYESDDEYYENYETGKTKLATKIMTNDVGDIVATGGMDLNIYSIFQTDAFIDLSKYIEGAPTYNDLSKTVLDAITMNDRIYGLPVGYRMVRMIYNKALGDEIDIDFNPSQAKWSDFLQYVRQVDKTGKDVYVYYGGTEVVLQHMLYSVLPDLVDLPGKKVELNQQWFLDLIREFKEVSRLKCFTNGINQGFAIAEIPEDCIFRGLRLYNAYNDIHDYLASPFEIQYIPVFSGEQNRNQRAYAYIMYSISNNSKNKDGAWDFLSFLLGEDVGTLNSLHSTPLNEKAVEKIYGNYEDIDELKAQYAEIINGIDYLHDTSGQNDYVLDLLNPLLRYINDEITLEEAIEQAEYNVWLRLNE